MKGGFPIWSGSRRMPARPTSALPDPPCPRPPPSYPRPPPSCPRAPLPSCPRAHLRHTRARPSVIPALAAGISPSSAQNPARPPEVPHPFPPYPRAHFRHTRACRGYLAEFCAEPRAASRSSCAGRAEPGAARRFARGWQEAGAGLGARRSEIPAASAGMTDLSCAGMTELFCAGMTERGYGEGGAQRRCPL